MDQKVATSIQFLVLVTSFVTSGKAPHFSENEMLDLVRVSEYTAHDSILAARVTLITGHYTPYDQDPQRPRDPEPGSPGRYYPLDGARPQAPSWNQPVLKVVVSAIIL